MTPRPASLLAGWAIALLAAGDAVRYTVGYAGWAVLCGLTLVAAVVVLVRARARLRATPVALAMLLALMLLSAIWAVAPLATLLGATLQVATAIAGVLLAQLDLERLLRLAHAVLQGILVVSIVFELAVALLVGGRLYPLVPMPGVESYGPDSPAAFAWSRGLLLEGGRIQGIVGNANLLAMLALLALVLAGCLAASRRLRAWPAWVALPLVTLALTRSATVLAALGVVAVVAALVVAWRRLPMRAFRWTLVAVGALAVAAVASVLVLRDVLLGLVGRDGDLTGRTDIWAAVVAEWLRSPVVGTGWVGYWPPFAAPYDDLAVHDGVVYLQAHSVVLDVLMQIGVVGLLAWLALQATTLVGAVRWLRDASAGDAGLRAAPLLVLVALLAQGLAESRPLIELGFALLVAFAWLLPARSRSRAVAA
ncbi:O-antigen ligase family protein [Agrococcus sp. SGAir0287]|uniref:O-antigen ligase family protein n=1 Tax=Agrococcus sp. SGAir0287 TaxID=2070347 RepID=UPI001586B145|nr:O-antigen ligase family protein [Agrococcus sp. SGAir0287]